MQLRFGGVGAASPPGTRSAATHPSRRPVTAPLAHRQDADPAQGAGSKAGAAGSFGAPLTAIGLQHVIGVLCMLVVIT